MSNTNPSGNWPSRGQEAPWAPPKSTAATNSAVNSRSQLGTGVYTSTGTAQQGNTSHYAQVNARERQASAEARLGPLRVGEDGDVWRSPPAKEVGNPMNVSQMPPFNLRVDPSISGASSTRTSFQPSSRAFPRPPYASAQSIAAGSQRTTANIRLPANPAEVKPASVQQENPALLSNARLQGTSAAVKPGYSPLPPFARGPSDNNGSTSNSTSSAASNNHNAAYQSYPASRGAFNSRGRGRGFSNFAKFSNQRAPSQPPHIANSNIQHQMHPAPPVAPRALRTDMDSRRSDIVPASREGAPSARPSPPPSHHDRNQWKGDSYVRGDDSSSRLPRRAPGRDDYDRQSRARSPADGHHCERRPSPPRRRDAWESDIYRPAKREPSPEARSPRYEPSGRSAAPRSFTPPPRTGVTAARPHAKLEPRSPVLNGVGSTLDKASHSGSARQQSSTLPADRTGAPSALSATSTSMPTHRVKAEPETPPVSKTASPLFTARTQSPEDVKPTVLPSSTATSAHAVASTAPTPSATIHNGAPQSRPESCTAKQAQPVQRSADAPSSQTAKPAVARTSSTTISQSAPTAQSRSAPTAQAKPSKQAASHMPSATVETSNSDMDVDALDGQSEASDDQVLDLLTNRPASASIIQPVTPAPSSTAPTKPVAGPSSLAKALDTNAGSLPSFRKKDAAAPTIEKPRSALGPTHTSAIVLSSDDEEAASRSLPMEGTDQEVGADRPAMYGMEVDPAPALVPDHLAASSKAASRPDGPPSRPPLNHSASSHSMTATLAAMHAEDAANAQPALEQRPDGEELSKVFPLPAKLLSKEKGTKAFRTAMKNFVEESYESLELQYQAPLQQIDEIPRQETTLRFCYSILQLLPHELAITLPQNCLRSGEPSRSEREDNKKAFETREVVRLTMEGRVPQRTRLTPAHLIVVLHNPSTDNTVSSGSAASASTILPGSMARVGLGNKSVKNMTISTPISREASEEAVKKRKRTVTDEATIFDDNASVASTDSGTKKGKREKERKRKLAIDASTDTAESAVPAIASTSTTVPERSALPSSHTSMALFSNNASDRSSQKSVPQPGNIRLPYQKSAIASVAHPMHASHLPKPPNTQEKARVMFYANPLSGFCAWSMRGHGVFWNNSIKVNKISDTSRLVSENDRQDANMTLQSAIWFAKHKVAVLAYSGSSATACMDLVRLRGGASVRIHHSLGKGDDLTGLSALSSYETSNSEQRVIGTGNNDRKCHIWSLDPVNVRGEGGLTKLSSIATTHSAVIRAITKNASRNGVYTAGADKKVCFVDLASNQCVDAWKENMGINRIYVRDENTMIVCLAGARDQFRCVDIRVKNTQGSAGLAFGFPTPKSAALGQYGHGDVRDNKFAYPIGGDLHIWDLRNTSSAHFSATGTSGIVQPIFLTHNRLALLEKQHFTTMSLIV